MLLIRSFNPCCRKSGTASRNVTLSPRKSGCSYTVMPLYPNPLPRCCADASIDNADTASASASASRNVIATSAGASCNRHAVEHGYISEQIRANAPLCPCSRTAHRTRDLEQEIRRSGDHGAVWTNVGPVRLSFDHFNRRVGLQREPAAAGRDDLHIRAFLLEAMAQKDQAAFEVVLHGRKAQRFVEANCTARQL